MGCTLILFTLCVVQNLVNSRSGRAIMATRDSRIAAESVGINITKYKMMAFVTSAVLAGMAGALYGLNFSTVAASKFKFDTSILVLVFVVLGGIGSIRGSIIAATLLTILHHEEGEEDQRKAHAEGGDGVDAHAALGAADEQLAGDVAVVEGEVEPPRVDGDIPVSYTHLDVYKRQSTSRS